MKIHDGDRIRIRFEYNYSSVNWGYIADFDVIKYKNLLVLNSEHLQIDLNAIPPSLVILDWHKIPNNTDKIWIDCTDNEEWCEFNATIDSILKAHYENTNHH